MDTEFTGLHQNTTIISLAIIDENNRQFYAEFTDYDRSQISQWHIENVVRSLLFKKIGDENTVVGEYGYVGDSAFITAKLKEWMQYYDKQPLTFVYDVGMYDWVLFCQLFGGSLSLPPNISYSPIEFSTILRICGIDSKVSRVNLLTQDEQNELATTGNLHNALYDTKLLKLCFEKLRSNPALERMMLSLTHPK
jgi:hypothetical protein